MSTPLAITAGLLLGAAGGLAHLGVLALRVRLLASRGLAFALLTFPLGLAGPAAAVLVAAWIGRPAAWASLGGLVVARWVALSRAEAPR